MKFLTRAKSLLLAGLSAVAPVGMAAAATASVVSPKTVIVEPSELSAQKIDAALPNLVGPGVHRIYQRPLSGLEIRAVRMQKRTVATLGARHLRSKYRNDASGVSCAMRKRASRDAAVLVAAAKAQGLV